MGAGLVPKGGWQPVQRRAREEERGRGHEVERAEIAQRVGVVGGEIAGRVLLAVGEEGTVRRAAVRVADHAVGEAEGAVRVRLHVVHLAAQLVRIAPQVVPLAQGDVLAPRTGIVERGVDGYAFGILVFGFKQGPDHVGIPARVVAQDLLRAVGGGVVVHQNLHRHILRQKALQRLCNVGRVVVCRAADAHHGLHPARLPSVLLCRLYPMPPGMSSESGPLKPSITLSFPSPSAAAHASAPSLQEAQADTAAAAKR